MKSVKQIAYLLLGATMASCAVDPIGPDESELGDDIRRVSRGGAFLSTAGSCRLGNRSFSKPTFGTNINGFRLVRTILD